MKLNNSYFEERIKFLLCLRLYLFDDYEMFKKNLNNDILEVYKLLNENIDIIKEYDNLYQYFEQNLSNLRDGFKILDMHRTGYYGHTKGRNGWEIGKSKAIMMNSIYKEELDNIRDNVTELKECAPNILKGVVQLILDMLEVGVLSFGIEDFTVDNRNLPNAKDGNLRVVICSTRMPIVLYTNKNEDRDEEDIVIHWIDCKAYFSLLAIISRDKNEWEYYKNRFIYYFCKSMDEFKGKDYYNVLEQFVSELRNMKK